MRGPTSNPGAALCQAALNEMPFRALLKLAQLVPETLSPIRLYGEASAKEEWIVRHRDATGILVPGLTAASEIEQRRNQLVHSQWLTDTGPPGVSGGVFRLKFRSRKAVFSGLQSRETEAALLSDVQACRQADGQINCAMREFHGLSQEYWSLAASAAQL